jgi:hypothetical protein
MPESTREEEPFSSKHPPVPPSENQMYVSKEFIVINLRVGEKGALTVTPQKSIGAGVRIGSAKVTAQRK